MINFNLKNWPKSLYYSYGMKTIGGSGLVKTNS